MKARSAAVFLIQLILGVSFIFYGMVKVLGGQFKYDDFLIDSRTTDGPTMVWTFYGYSPFYGRLIGLAEILAGVLVLIPWTRTLGALLLFPIAANITVMDFCFDFPAVKYTALLLTLLDVVLLAVSSRKLKLLLQLALVADHHLQDVRLDTVIGGPEPRPLSEAVSPGLHAARSRWRVGIKYSLMALLGLCVALFLMNLLLAALSNPVEAAAAFCAEQGWKREELMVLRWKMISGWSGFDRKGYVEFQPKGKNPSKTIRIEVHKPNSFVGWRLVDYQESHTPAP